MALKVVSQVQVAEGEYGKLKAEITRDGEIISVTVKVKQGDIAGMGGTHTTKYHFHDVQEMKDLGAALADAVAFLGGTRNA